MDQAYDLRQRSVEHALKKRKSLHLYIQHKEEAFIIEQLIQSLSDYGYESFCVATPEAKARFRPKFQDQLLHPDVLQQSSSLRIDVCLFIQVKGEEVLRSADIPAILFLSANEERLLDAYQLLKNHTPPRAYIIGAEVGSNERNQQARLNLRKTASRFLEIDVVDLGLVNQASAGFTDAVYEAIGLLIKDWLMAK
ncbi:hypothetical protein JCM19047_4167 [Bacillus sp. JCM 19047]|nr:hypothetical protein JCM19047_4167 [Bacillus sp. JCM 19047]